MGMMGNVVKLVDINAWNLSKLQARLTSTAGRDPYTTRRAKSLDAKFDLVGMKSNFSKSPTSAQVHWDGHHLYRKDMNVANDAHELAHYLVAPENRRTVPEFGLGNSPEVCQWAKYRPCSIPHNEANEEEAASILGMLILFDIGYRTYEVFIDHNWEFIDHNWENCDILPPLCWLQSRGKLGEDYEPIYRA